MRIKAQHKLYLLPNQYTLNKHKRQANLAFLTIFVNYVNFYVNNIMSTSASRLRQSFIIFNYNQYIAQITATYIPYIGHEILHSLFARQVSKIYLYIHFVQNHHFFIRYLFCLRLSIVIFSINTTTAPIQIASMLCIIELKSLRNTAILISPQNNT